VVTALSKFTDAKLLSDSFLDGYRIGLESQISNCIPAEICVGMNSVIEAMAKLAPHIGYHNIASISARRISVRPGQGCTLLIFPCRISRNTVNRDTCSFLVAAGIVIRAQSSQ
jgi:hypothetical protein